MFQISRSVSLSKKKTLAKLCRHPIDSIVQKPLWALDDVLWRYMILICIAYQNVYFAIGNISAGHHDSKEKLKWLDKNLDAESISIFSYCTLWGGHNSGLTSGQADRKSATRSKWRFTCHQHVISATQIPLRHQIEVVKWKIAPGH